MRFVGDETAADPGELADAAEVKGCCGCDGEGGIIVDADVQIVVVVVVVVVVEIRPSGISSLALECVHEGLHNLYTTKTSSMQSAPKHSIKSCRCLYIGTFQKTYVFVQIEHIFS